MGTPSQKRGTGRDPAGPLTHPVRRRILRFLHRSSKPKGACEVAKALEEPVAQIRYHLHALAIYGTTKEAGSGRDEENSQLYESGVSENDEILGLLEATETEDRDKGRKAA